MGEASTIGWRWYPGGCLRLVNERWDFRQGLEGGSPLRLVADPQVRVPSKAAGYCRAPSRRRASRGVARPFLRVTTGQRSIGSFVETRCRISGHLRRLAVRHFAFLSSNSRRRSGEMLSCPILSARPAISWKATAISCSGFMPVLTNACSTFGSTVPSACIVVEMP